MQKNRRNWLSGLRRYLGVTVGGHLLWETLQVPLYAIWEKGSVAEIAVAVVHCTGGDLLIALASLVAALSVAGSLGWPETRFRVVAVLTIAFGLLYAVYSEWLNVSVRVSWSYSFRMPTLPPFGTGLSPFLQWLVVPGVALAAARSFDRTGPRGQPKPQAPASDTEPVSLTPRRGPIA